MGNHSKDIYCSVCHKKIDGPYASMWVYHYDENRKRIRRAHKIFCDSCREVCLEGITKAVKAFDEGVIC